MNQLLARGDIQEKDAAQRMQNDHGETLMLRKTFIAITSAATLCATLANGSASGALANSYQLRPAWPSKVSSGDTQAVSMMRKPKEIVVVGSKVRRPPASKNTKRSKDPDYPYKGDDVPAGKKKGPSLKTR